MDQLEEHFSAYLDPVNEYNQSPVTQQIDSAAQDIEWGIQYLDLNLMKEE